MGKNKQKQLTPESSEQEDFPMEDGESDLMAEEGEMEMLQNG